MNRVLALLTEARALLALHATVSEPTTVPVELYPREPGAEDEELAAQHADLFFDWVTHFGPKEKFELDTEANVDTILKALSPTMRKRWLKWITNYLKAPKAKRRRYALQHPD